MPKHLRGKVIIDKLVSKTAETTTESITNATITGGTITTATITNATLEGEQLDLGTSVTASTDVALTSTKIRPIRVAELTLTAVVVTITAAADYGSKAICVLPNTNVEIVGVVADLVGTEDGAVITDPETVDVAIGTTAIATTTFSNATEQNLISEADVAAAGVYKGATGATASVKLAAAADNTLYLNNQATIASDGTMSWTGTVKVFYVDLDKPA